MSFRRLIQKLPLKKKKKNQVIVVQLTCSLSVLFPDMLANFNVFSFFFLITNNDIYYT